LDLKATFNIFRRTIILLLCCSCTSLFFYPEKEHLISPSEIGIKFQDIYFKTQSAKLHAWFLKAEGESKGTILFLHGNAGNISSHLPASYWLPKHGYNVLMPDYRGYGKSSGNASVKGIHKDMQIYLDYLDKMQKRYGVFGQSLGGSIAIQAVAEHEDKSKIAFIISDSAFSSYRTIVKEKIKPFFLLKPFAKPLSYITKNNYSAEKHIEKISPIPLLVTHGTEDEVVDFSHAETLFKKAKQPKTFLEINGGKHTLHLYENKKMQETLLKFIKLYF